MEKIIVNEKNAGLFFTQDFSQKIKTCLTAKVAENAEEVKGISTRDIRAKPKYYFALHAIIASQENSVIFPFRLLIASEKESLFFLECPGFQYKGLNPYRKLED